MSTFASLLQRMRGLRVLVVGDLMLDEYVIGRATKISQEAPVMVIRQSSVRAVPGGAANVAHNLRALGALTSVVGVVGDDEAGRALDQALKAGELMFAGLISDPSRPTTKKTRVLADSAHQVLRIDHEERKPVSEAIEALIIDAVGQQIGNHDTVLVSDYQKGGVTPGIVSEIVRRASAAQVPVVANAKPKSIATYRGATLVSLNRPEAAEAADLPELRDEELSLEQLKELGMRAARLLADRFGIEHVLVTLGGSGMCSERFYVGPRSVEVFDEAGAGDTTIATVTLGLAAIGFDPAVFHLAAQTAAAVVQRVGVATPSPADLAEIAGRQVPA